MILLHILDLFRVINVNVVSNTAGGEGASVSYIAFVHISDITFKPYLSTWYIL